MRILGRSSRFTALSKKPMMLFLQSGYAGEGQGASASGKADVDFPSIRLCVEEAIAARPACRIKTASDL
jgi:hypothetical protein